MKEIKILLVDDEEDFVKTLSDRINMRNLSSSVALNGEAALQIVENEIPDVMILDLKMPGIDGMEVLRRIRRLYPQVQVIMLTGHGSAQDKAAALELGAYGYMSKPVAIDDLIQKIRQAYADKIERPLMAGAFAEAGEFETASRIMNKKQD